MARKLTQPTLTQVCHEAYRSLWQTTKNANDVYRTLGHICEILGHGTPIRSVANTADILTLKRAWEDLSGARRNRKLSAWRQVLSYACEADYIDSLPRFPRKERESAGRERFLTVEEVDSIFSHLTQPHLDICTFLLHTGARYGEAMALRDHDIDHKAHSVTFSASTTKSGKSRTIPLTPLALKSVNTVLNSHINHKTVYRHFKRAVELSRVPDPSEITIHTLRHTCASWLVTKGIDIRRVQRWLGHSSVVTTERYAELTRSLDTLKEASLVLGSTFQGDTGCKPSHHREYPQVAEIVSQGAMGECPEWERGRTVNPISSLSRPKVSYLKQPSYSVRMSQLACKPSKK